MGGFRALLDVWYEVFCGNNEWLIATFTYRWLNKIPFFYTKIQTEPASGGVL